MLSRLELRNFKGIEEADFDLARINLFYGPNSGGKSTVLQALLFLQQTLEAAPWFVVPVFSGHRVDLGSYYGTVFNHRTERDIGIAIEVPVQDATRLIRLELTYRFDQGTGRAYLHRLRETAWFMHLGQEEGELPVIIRRDRLDDAAERPGEQGADGEAEPRVPRCEVITLAGNPSNRRLTPRPPDASEDLSPWGTAHGSRERSSIGGGEIDFPAAVDVTATLTKSMNRVSAGGATDRQGWLDIIGFDLDAVARQRSDLAEGVRVVFQRSKAVVRARGGAPVYRGEDTAVDPDAIPETGPEEVIETEREADSSIADFLELPSLEGSPAHRKILASLRKHMRMIEANLGRVTHVGPHRPPPRRGGFSQVRAGTDEILRRITRDSESLAQLNNAFHLLQIPYRIEVGASDGPVTGKVRSVFLRSLDGPGEENEPGVIVGLQDVGYGISQVLPVAMVLVDAVQHEQLVLIQQPELHLHPALQAEVGELLINLTDGASQEVLVANSQVFCESHSEVLVMRLQKRIQDQDLSHRDLMVHYVHRLDGASRAVYLELDEEGDFLVAWPKGFFEERYAEEMQ